MLEHLTEHTLLPHAVCLAADQVLLGTLVLGDVVHWFSYRMIALLFVLWVFGFVKVPPRPARAALLVLTAVFVFTCGDTHYWALHVMWSGNYLLQASWMMVSAAISLATLLAGWFISEWRPQVTWAHPARYSFYAMGVVLVLQYQALDAHRSTYCAVYGCG